MNWLTSDITWLVGSFALIALLFAFKLNRRVAVPTNHGTDDPVDAIEYFWRPG